MHFGGIKKAYPRFAPRGYAVKTALSRLWLSHPALFLREIRDDSCLAAYNT
jgi:hypothetical protein